MSELFQMVQAGFSGVSLTVLVMILYRVTQIEKDLAALTKDHNETSAEVIRLKTLAERK